MRYDMAIKVKFKKLLKWIKKVCVIFDVAKKWLPNRFFPCFCRWTLLSLSPNLLNSTLRRIKLKTFLISMEAGGWAAFDSLFSNFHFIIVNILWFHRNLFAHWKHQFIASFDEFNGAGLCMMREKYIRSSKCLFYAIFQAAAASAHGVGSASRGSVNAVVPTKTPIKTTTDDTPDFDRSKVRWYSGHDTFTSFSF